MKPETPTTEAKHTPGKWQLTTVPFELIDTDDAASIYGPMSRDGGACLIACISRSPGDSEATANAYLIAAAPETAKERDELKAINAQLLEALMYVRRFVNSKDVDVNYIDNVIVLAKQQNQ